MFRPRFAWRLVEQQRVQRAFRVPQPHRILLDLVWSRVKDRRAFDLLVLQAFSWVLTGFIFLMGIKPLAWAR